MPAVVNEDETSNAASRRPYVSPIWLIVLILLIIAVAGGIAISKFLFLILIIVVIVALVGGRGRL
jgi:uncharacterized membrane protein